MKIIILSLFISAVICAQGVDVSNAVSSADFSCLLKQGYTFSIVRCFRSSGSVDPNCASSVANSHSAGMDNVDIYMFPCFKCGNPFNQMSDTLNYTKQNGVKYNTLWLDIEGSQYWGSVSDNVNFFQQLVNAGEHLGATMGVYTSSSQWTPIMGSSTSGSAYPLWYAHYDNDKSFSDFTPFGGWRSPTMKQYNGDQTVCGAGVDLNWIPGGNSTTGPSTVASGPATHTTGPATHTTGPATHTTGPATHSSGPATHSTVTGPDSTGPASNTHSSGPDSTGPASSTTSGSSYSGGGDTSGSSADFKFLDHAIYNARLGGNRIPIVQEIQEVQEVRKKQQKEKEAREGDHQKEEEERGEEQKGKEEKRGEQQKGKEEEEVKKKKISVKFAEVEDALEKDAHFKVVEEKSFNKFFKFQ